MKPKRYKIHVFYGGNRRKVVLFLASLAFLSRLANAETVKIAINPCCVTEDATVKEILRPEDITMGPVDGCGEGCAPARVRSARFLGTRLRVEAETAEGNLLVALLLRSHPMAAAIDAGDDVSARAVRGSVLPDPLEKREPEYCL